jgi:transcriptional regulator with XRE-family HTH domain
MASLETFRSFGESLKAARIEQKRSLDDVASAIKINRHHLEAIEAGDIAKLPQGPYAAAFLREYAKVLGLKVPAEFAPNPGASPSSPRDPKVVSHPAGLQERSAQLSQAARGTARLANTAVKSAVKTVSKTTENVVNLVETGGKEALEVFTSKSLWDEAENIRRERHGLPPIEHPDETPPTRSEEEKPKNDLKRSIVDIRNAEEAASSLQLTTPIVGQRIPKPVPIRSSKRITNIVIVSLALVFAFVAYMAIRMSKNDNASVASKDYIPAPVEKPQPIVTPKHEAAPTTSVATVTSSSPKDSLRFVMRALEPVWVSIAPDGIPAYRGELKAGEVRSFRAGDKFVINIGNQKSVAMSFDGAPLSSLPPVPNSSVVVRDLVLTRDHATIGGTTVDLHKPASYIASSKPVAAAASSKIVASSVKKSLPVSTKKVTPLPTPHKSATATAKKGTLGKPATTKKTTKKPSLPPLVIHPVNPIPARP